MLAIERQLRSFRYRSADICRLLQAGRGERPGSLAEGDDHYAHVVALLHPRWRVVLSKQGEQWVLQSRSVAIGKISRTAWRKEVLAISRDELLKAVEALSVTVDPAALETLKSLPDRAALCPSPLGLPPSTRSSGDSPVERSTLSDLLQRRRAAFGTGRVVPQGSSRESDDHYRGGVCRLNDSWRVILTKDRSQFALQRREGRMPCGRPRWASRSFSKSKSVLLRDVARFSGRVDPLARMVLDQLPVEAPLMTPRS